MLPELEIAVRLLVAATLGSLIGFERERLLWAAGIRTHMLVCVGACLVMIVSAYGFNDVLSDHVVLDPSRVAAQVVSGIGFLGAGSISETIDRWLVGFRAVNPKKVWLQRYVHRDDPNADPVVKHSKQTVEPFFWGDVLTEEEKKKRGGFVSEALVVPVPSPRGLVGMMVMAGEHADRNHLHNYKPVLQAIGLASYHHIERHCAPPDAPAPQHAPPGLTPREQEILSLVSEGLSAPEIGRKVNISERTVEWHLDKSMKKLEAKNRIQAVVLAIRDGLIPLC